MTNWTIDRSEWERHGPTGQRIYRFIVSDEGELIADIWADSANLNHALPADPIGNARKIAAVPRMIRALEALIARADDLTAAIEGVTDQFEDEVSQLCDAASAAERVLIAARGRK